MHIMVLNTAFGQAQHRLQTAWHPGHREETSIWFLVAVCPKNINVTSESNHRPQTSTQPSETIWPQLVAWSMDINIASVNISASRVEFPLPLPQCCEFPMGRSCVSFSVDNSSMKEHIYPIIWWKVSNYLVNEGVHN